MRVIFISHPYSDRPAANVGKVRLIARRVALGGDTPICPQLSLPQFLDESRERDIALRICLVMLARCDEIQVHGQPSPGMLKEISEAERLGIPVIDQKEK